MARIMKSERNPDIDESAWPDGFAKGARTFGEDAREIAECRSFVDESFIPSANP